MNEQTVSAADRFLLGRGIPAAKFTDPGDSHAGTITDMPEVRQQREYGSGKPLFWEDGSPKEQLVVHIATDERDPDVDGDDGVRAIYAKGNMRDAITAAVRRAITRTGVREGLRPGGRLTVTYTGDGQGNGPIPPKLYAAEYIPPAPAAAKADDGEGYAFEDGTPLPPVPDEPLY